ncbi:T9SS-dependent M36 family metallopeptidase [uncultured Dokdonia sp.]|uniref:T9SS-dependent M36 family metallopeptidase n=1 Tax=uncultured Dokdonia sp. TaxID=575653 RepID=UPI0026137C96|nr:T9SS-dependent M36 family metallopeptidase [uncultured Dokdonia sp.]
MLKLYKLTVFVCVFAFASLTNAQDYGTIIRDHLDANKSTLGITDQDISGLRVKDEIFSRKSTTTHVHAIQTINNIEVFNGGVNVAFKDGTIIHVASSLEKDIASRVNAVSPVLTPVQAASSAASSLGLGSANFSLNQTISSQEFVLTQGGVSLEEVPVKLVYQATEDNALKLAWDLSIHTIDSKHWYSVRVDALNGELLSQHDWVVSCTFENHSHEAIASANEDAAGFSMEQNITVANELLAGEQYNVYAMPVESPNHGGRSIVTEPQDLVASPFGWHDTNGAEGAEFTITRGNNVWAQEDANGNNGVGDAPDGGAELIFDFPLDESQDAATFTEAATVNLFYWNNIMHDVFYQYGFDEESGNFQENNYGNGGTGSDFVFADAQDGSGVNNATFGTPPDGQNPGMTMFLWNTGGTPNVNIPSGDVAGDYPITSSTFSDAWPIEGITGDLVLAMDDDASDSDDPLDICDALTNPGDMDGKIAVVRRGSCNFTLKVETVQAEGAIAVIIVNNVADAPINLGGDSAIATIPAGMVTQAVGEDIIAALQNGDAINDVVITGARRIDGDLDNLIIGHEYGHGISNRLTGGRFNSGCLSNAEQMGEGWSDYVGLMLTMTADDTAEEGRGIGTYAINQPITGLGIRPARYSVDFSVNALTYDDVNNPNISQPHGIGTVWATMLWDMTWAFIDEYGFDDDFYNGTGGNNIAMQLVIDGLKLQPCSPGFIDGRDAIIAAVAINDLIPEGQKDFARCTIWNVFATRGLGFSAEQGSSNNRFDQVEAFDLPEDVLEDCSSLSVDENSLDSVFSVFPNPSNGEITVSIAGAFGDGQIRIYDINGREVYNKPATLEGNVSVNAAGLSRGVYIMNITGDSNSYTTKLIIE